MEGSKNGGSEQASSSDDGQLLVALRKMMKKEIEVMVISTVQQLIKPTMEKEIEVMVISTVQQLIKPIVKEEIEVMVINTVRQVIVPTFEDFIRKILKEEIQSAKTMLLTGETRNYANEMTILKERSLTISKERSLQLKFLDEVSVPVLTGKVINGRGGNPMEVALVDRTTGQVVNCGPESSAKVEILVLDASGDDNEHSWTLENFNNRIIREGDKKKPHFAKCVYVCLKEGVGILENAKLGHESNWMKSCKCRLGARIMENFRGIEVQEAWTESFMVSDKRSGLYEKHHPPSLSDEVWRLENIGRDGEPCKRLKKENILTVRDFLFLHSVHPQRLQQIVRARGMMWEATVNHAWTCITDDKRLYYPSTEFKMGVIFDSVGRLKGIIQESHYVPITNLSDDEKDCAYKLHLSAFENQRDITSFDDEASLLKRFPCRSSDINAASNSSIQEGSNGCDLSTSENRNGYHPTEPEPGTSSQNVSADNLTMSENINGCHPIEPGTSSQSISQDNLVVSENINGCHPSESGTSSQSISPDTSTSDHPNNISHFGSLESTDTGQLYDANLSVLIKVPSCQFFDLENINKYAPRDPGTSYQSIGPSIRTFDLPHNIFHFGSLGSQTMGQLYEAHSGVQIPSCPFPDLDSILERFGENGNLICLFNPEISNLSQTLRAESDSHLPNNIFHFDSLGSPNMRLQYEAHLGVQIPSCKFSYPEFILEPSGDNWRLMNVVNSEINNSETLWEKSHSHQQSNARVYRLVGRVVNGKLWMVRAKKRAMALEGIHVHKKQKLVHDLNLDADTASEVTG